MILKKRFDSKVCSGEIMRISKLLQHNEVAKKPNHPQC